MARIYNHYVTQTAATFEVRPIAASMIAERVEEIMKASLPWIVAETGGGIVGYAHASPWKSRHAYRFSVETTVYVDRLSLRQGIGALLYGELIAHLEQRSVRVAIGGIALPNDGCVALHEKLGFEKVAHFRDVGFKFGRWIDVGYWQRILRTDSLESAGRSA